MTGRRGGGGAERRGRAGVCCSRVPRVHELGRCLAQHVGLGRRVLFRADLQAPRTLHVALVIVSSTGHSNDGSGVGNACTVHPAS